MKVGLLGSGMVAQTLGSGFLKYGHTVMLGTRSPEKLKEWQKKAGANAHIGSFQQAAKFGEILVLAVKGLVAEQVLHSASVENLREKTIIDATNPLAESAPVNGVLNFFTEQNNSLMEDLQHKFPQARFVKAFNSIGSAVMVNPDYNGVKPSMFICGNNKEAKQQVTEILHLFGWEVEDMGAMEAARAIEPLCMLWCIPGFNENRWTHAFKLLKK